MADWLAQFDDEVSTMLGGKPYRPAEAKSYAPTLRDRIAGYLMGDERASTYKARFVEGLLGSRGMGTTGVGVADVTPLGIPMGLQDAIRAGDPNAVALAIMPGGGVANKAGQKIAKEAAGEVKQGIAADKSANIEQILSVMRGLPKERRVPIAGGFDVVSEPSVGNVNYYVVPSKAPVWLDDGSSAAIGTFTVRPSQRMDATGVEITNARVRKDMRRKGIGSSVYNVVEDDFRPYGGLVPSPDGQLSQEALDFWSKRRGKAQVP